MGSTLGISLGAAKDMTRGNKKIGLTELVAIGIGGMVGGGIFAVLGLAVSLAGGGTPAAFLIAGSLALITAKSYSRLSLSFPDRGGTVRFINQGFGRSVFSGGINNLLWLSYVIMLSLYASAFASYAANLLPFFGNGRGAFHLFATGIIITATIINYASVKVVGIIEDYAVVIKLLILLVFTVFGLYGLFSSSHLSQLAPANWKSPLSLLTGGMVIFVAYEGFELIANAAPDVVNPEKNIPLAYSVSVIFVICLYLVIAVITVGSLSFDTIASAEDYALAEAARPVLGQSGFVLIGVAALISTFSAINASLYGGSRVSYEIAEDDELPHEFSGKLWNHPVGLLITSGITLVVVNLINLESISTAGSAGFILVFSLVNFTAFKYSRQSGRPDYLAALGFFLGLVSLMSLMVQQFISNFFGAVFSVAIIIFSLAVEWGYKWLERMPEVK